MNKFTLQIILLFFLQACGSNKNEAVQESELPKFILSSFKESNDFITWKVTIVDSAITKNQLISVATQIKSESEFEHVIVHFYSPDMDKENSSLVSIHYNPNETLPDQDRNGFRYEYQDRSSAFVGSETSVFKIK